MPEGQPSVQPARCPRRNRRDRARRLHPARPGIGERLLRSLARPARQMSRAQPGRRGELLLEVHSEEIPARMQRRAIADLTGLLQHKLAAAALPSETIRGYVTPRRLAVIAEG